MQKIKRRNDCNQFRGLALLDVAHEKLGKHCVTNKTTNRRRNVLHFVVSFCFVRSSKRMQMTYYIAAYALAVSE